MQDTKNLKRRVKEGKKALASVTPEKRAYWLADIKWTEARIARRLKNRMKNLKAYSKAN